ncbi:MAG: sodium-dependent transporter [Gemmatimonadetes bacterium]|nr:sodium-dependent transporter [Gemmatimonadota bacterium]MBT8478746.1 sodium-dependent transporter [Gemmatimonadota bacterium]NNK47527.1 sodium-dependent transporter [Gemmatimonadota bacterium]
MDPSTGKPRDTWGSKVAFVLAAAGSAVGLGNIWGFPTVAGQNGGAAFLLIYLAAVALIGAPVMLAELIVGRRTQRNPVGAFKALAPRTMWVVVGGLGVFTGIVILSFYSVIAGWTLSYIFKTIAGTFQAGVDTEAIYNDLAGSAVPAISWHLLFMVITVYVVLGGVRDGIERWTKVLMPVLFGLLALLAFRAVTLSGAGAGLDFYLRPDFSKVTGAVILSAIGQAFFSLSLGMGAMITYGSYVSKRDDLVSSAGWVTLADTTIAILAGLIIFPTLFHAGLEPGAGGPGMVFVVLTSLLSSIPPAPYGGIVFGTGFFMLLGIAALTSSVSLLEVVTSWAVDERGMSRRKAAITLGSIAFLLGIPSALANGAVPWLTNLPGVGMDFLSFLFMLFGQYSLVIGALLISLFVGWVWGVKAAGEEVRENDGEFPLGRTWGFLIRFVAPSAIVAILVKMVVDLV